MTRSKPGRHGTLYRYRIVYRDDADPGAPDETWLCWAYSAEHAEILFVEGESAGWEIVSGPTRVK